MLALSTNQSMNTFILVYFQALELMWADYLQHLQESVQNPLLTYTSHFTPLKVIH